jgi:hypothetical protein
VNALNGLDGKSVLVGALVVGGLVATQGGLLPVLLVGGLVYLIGSKQGFWGNGPRRWGSDAMGHRAPGAPAFFEEWHRQAHANDAAHQTAAGQPATYQPAAPAPASAQTPAAEVRIPVTPASAAPAAPTAPVEPAPVAYPAAQQADDRPTAGQHGAPLA